MQKFSSPIFWKAFPRDLLCMAGCGQWIKLRPDLPQSLSPSQPASQDISSPSGPPALAPHLHSQPLSPGLKDSFSPGWPHHSSLLFLGKAVSMQRGERSLQAARHAPDKLVCRCEQPAPRTLFAVMSAPENTNSQRGERSKKEKGITLSRNRASLVWQLPAFLPGWRGCLLCFTESQTVVVGRGLWR